MPASRPSKRSPTRGDHDRSDGMGRIKTLIHVNLNDVLISNAEAIQATIDWGGSKKRASEREGDSERERERE